MTEREGAHGGESRRSSDCRRGDGGKRAGGTGGGRAAR